MCVITIIVTNLTNIISFLKSRKRKKTKSVATAASKRLHPVENVTAVSFKSSYSIEPQFGMRVAVLMGDEGNSRFGTIINVNQPTKFMTINFYGETKECGWKCTDPNLSFVMLHEIVPADSVDPEIGMFAAVKDDEGNSRLGSIIDVNQPIQFMTIWFDDGPTECEWKCSDPNLCFLTDSNGVVINVYDNTLDCGAAAAECSAAKSSNRVSYDSNLGADEDNGAAAVSSFDFDRDVDVDFGVDYGESSSSSMDGVSKDNDKFRLVGIESKILELVEELSVCSHTCQKQNIKRQIAELSRRM